MRKINYITFAEALCDTFDPRDKRWGSYERENMSLVIVTTTPTG